MARCTLAGQPGRRARPRPSGADVGAAAGEHSAHRPDARRGDAPAGGARARVAGHRRTLGYARRRHEPCRRRGSDDAAVELGETGGPGQHLVDPVLAQSLRAFGHGCFFDHRGRGLFEDERPYPRRHDHDFVDGAAAAVAGCGRTAGTRRARTSVRSSASGTAGRGRHHRHDRQPLVLARCRRRLGSVGTAGAPGAGPRRR